MTAPIEDVSSLPGKKISDQEKEPIGEVQAIYATDDGFPMWVAVEVNQGMNKKRTAVIPLARIKDENGELRVPYSKEKIAESPEVDDEGISEECDFELRGYYGIGTGDQEMWSDNKGYVTMVVEENTATQKVENADDLETPEADQRTEESQQRLEDPGSSEMRQVSAEDVAEGKDDQTGGGGEDKGEDDDDGQEDDDGQAEGEKDDDGQAEGKEDEGEQPEGKEDEDEQPQGKEGGDEQAEGKEDEEHEAEGKQGEDEEQQQSEEKNEDDQEDDH